MVLTSECHQIKDLIATILYTEFRLELRPEVSNALAHLSIWQGQHSVQRAHLSTNGEQVHHYHPKSVAKGGDPVLGGVQGGGAPPPRFPCF